MLNKHKKIVCVLIGVLFSMVITGILVTEKKELLQKEIASEVLRFHVLANSNRAEDQVLKLKVKDSILSFMKKELPESNDKKESRKWVSENLAKIQNVACEVVRKEGYDYQVEAYLQECEFPEKTYGDITFPAGNYEALRVEIGTAKGQNWWCVLYPNLCFTDAVHAVVPEQGKDDLKEVLDDEAYELVTSKTIFKIRWFFF